jgi:hypothetical protein
VSAKHRIDEDTSLEEVAALVCTTLEAQGISVVLSGGAVVSIYSDAEYVSYDLDFIPIGLARKVDGSASRSGSVTGRIPEAGTGSSSRPAPSPSGKRRFATLRNARLVQGPCACSLRLNA